jgi:hypothetical protein
MDYAEKSQKVFQDAGNSPIDCKGEARLITTKPHLIDEFQFDSVSASGSSTVRHCSQQWGHFLAKHCICLIKYHQIKLNELESYKAVFTLTTDGRSNVFSCK